MVSKRKRDIDSQQTRRAMLRIGAGGVLAVGLAACGGGGDGDSDELDLRAAYDKISAGMSMEQAIGVVGRQPNSTSSNNYGVDRMYWDDGAGQLLSVGVHDLNRDVTYARWDKLTIPSETLRKSFY